MNAVVIDASIALKWVVQEDGTEQALRLRRSAKLLAPDLLAVECANILWKKVQRRELVKDEALFAARLLQGADIELLPTRSLLESAVRIAIEIGHPAYDCVYVALAIDRNCRFVTADERLLRKLNQKPRSRLRNSLIPLRDSVDLQGMQER
ncbi:MAG TPA: type II toxin-antitoxin system VapC family toxin [Candidatus Acidoferrales bacterium]|nr:type II toxin-antitoxin system VapC family toxin [Candidatus Acidoferrales bacterium]